MGYRSEIIAGVPLKDKSKALEIIKDWNNEAEDDEMYYMRGDYWKWYDCFSEVKKFEDFISKNDKRFLLVLGEDGACVSQLGDPCEYGVYQMSIIEHNINFKERK
tara:strand:+ start:4253 stop:4567 length:315 start_codon:yes stop_codon:yes gene_type:complete